MTQSNFDKMNKDLQDISGQLASLRRDFSNHVRDSEKQLLALHRDLRAVQQQLSRIEALTKK